MNNEGECIMVKVEPSDIDLFIDCKGEQMLSLELVRL